MGFGITAEGSAGTVELHVKLSVWVQPLLLASLNDALNLIGIRIIEVGDQWSVSEGKALIRFSDNVVRATSPAAIPFAPWYLETLSKQ